MDKPEDLLKKLDASEKNTKAWEQETLEKLVFESLKEHRNTRRWKIFFRFVYLALFVTIVLLIKTGSTSDSLGRTKSHTAMIKIDGELMSDSSANADDIIDSLKDAFDSEETKGIILNINSPGGSPVQAGEIYDEIMTLRKDHPKVKVYAVCTDICASGAYYVAAAADEIYVDKASLVGSIGVLMNGFGFVDTLDKVGVQRRLLTAGKHKGIMDPFSPMDTDDKQYMQGMLDDIHQQFIDSVKKGRGNRLKINDDTFSGLVWTGDTAVKLGLADGLASPQQVADNIIKESNIVDYTTEHGFLETFAGKMGKTSSETFAKILGISTTRIS